MRVSDQMHLFDNTGFEPLSSKWWSFEISINNQENLSISNYHHAVYSCQNNLHITFKKYLYHYLEINHYNIFHKYFNSLWPITLHYSSRLVNDPSTNNFKQEILWILRVKKCFIWWQHNGIICSLSHKQQDKSHFPIY